MRKSLLGVVFGAFGIASVMATAQAGERVEIGELGLATPESVLYDAANDVYLVSNINGNPSAVDGNGFISRLSPDGKVLALKWIDGASDGVDLDGPKGLTISGGVLYVSDITEVRLFDANTGAPKGSVAISGSSFLNDAAPGPDGSAYITDTGIDFSTGQPVPTGTEAIYRVDAAGATKLADGDLDLANGLAVDKDGTILMVGFGGRGLLSSYAPDGSSKGSTKIGVNTLDGINVLPDGSILVSSWATNSVHKVSGGSEPTVVVDNVPTPADFGYDTKRNRLLIPIFTQDRLVFVDLD